MGLDAIPRTREPWARSARIVSSRFPPVGLFDRVADPEDLDAVFALEALTNPRLRDQVGQIALMPPEERLSGPGTTPIMAAFTHLNPAGSRFTDGTYGIYYAGRTLETAIRETVFHREQFMRASREPPMHLEMRVYYADLDAEFHDIRGLRAKLPGVYAPDSYADSQPFGRALRATQSWGIYYDSVRDPGGECAAVFRPRAISPVTQGPHLVYGWDGARIAHVYELHGVTELR